MPIAIHISFGIAAIAKTIAPTIAAASSPELPFLLRATVWSRDFRGLPNLFLPARRFPLRYGRV
jgi:hypothetical protein